MKLYWSSRSPYVRKVMVAAHEVGLADRITKVPVTVTVTETHAELIAINPLGKIPTLVLDDGSALFDSLVIVDYLDGLHAGAKLIPEHRPARLIALRRNALGDGLMEALMAQLGERFRQQPVQSDKRIAASRAKVVHTLKLLDADAAGLADTPFSLGHAAVGSALAYMDFRFGDEPWRDDHRRLAEWHAEFSRRPSAIATRFFDDLKAAQPVAHKA